MLRRTAICDCRLAADLRCCGQSHERTSPNAGSADKREFSGPCSCGKAPFPSTCLVVTSFLCPSGYRLQPSVSSSFAATAKLGGKSGPSGFGPRVRRSVSSAMAPRHGLPRGIFSAISGRRGSIRDLSHELDYVLWLFGPWQRLAALGGHLSSLDIDSDDAYSLLLETERCPLITIHLNYLDRTARREVSLQTNQSTVRADFISGIFDVNGLQQTMTVDIDSTYRAEHQAMLEGNAGQLCNLAEAMETLHTIAAAERASSTHAWATR